MKNAARRWLIENEMLEEGEDLTDYNMDSAAVYNIDEQLLQIHGMVVEMEKQLDSRYHEFTVVNLEMLKLGLFFRSTVTI
jgi:hypothetical protein